MKLKSVVVESFFFSDLCCRLKFNPTRKKEGICYFRFLSSFNPSISISYLKPASISCRASFALFAILHIYSSS